MVDGVTEAPAEAALVPALLVAVTVQEYVVPLDKPLTTIGLPVPLFVNPPQVAVYPVIVSALVGAEKLTVAEPLPLAALTPVGAEGAEKKVAK